MNESNYTEQDISVLLYNELEVKDFQFLFDFFYWELDHNFSNVWNTEYTRIVGDGDDDGIYDAREFDIILRERNDSLYAYRIHCRSYDDLLEIVIGWLISSVKKCRPDFTPDDIYFNLLADMSLV